MKDRKALRLSNFDYSGAGSYFITTCIENHICYFGRIHNGKMIHNEYGKIALKLIEWLFEQYEYVDVKHFIVMPNHVHAIIELKPVEKGIKKLSLSQLIGAYKTKVSAEIHKAGLTEFKWQRSYYDHIIRNMLSYENIAQYILNNPLNWPKDRFYKQIPSE